MYEKYNPKPAFKIFKYFCLKHARRSILILYFVNSGHIFDRPCANERKKKNNNLLLAPSRQLLESSTSYCVACCQKVCRAKMWKNFLQVTRIIRTNGNYFKAFDFSFKKPWQSFYMVVFLENLRIFFFFYPLGGIFAYFYFRGKKFFWDRKGWILFY